MTIANSFAELRLRLDRVDDQLKAISQQIEVLNVQAREVVGHYEPSTSDYVFRVVGDPPPLSIGLHVGEAVHNLRATLDNMVYALVSANGETPTTSTQFVIAETQRSWDGQTGKANRDRLSGLSVRQRQLMESLQPFKTFGFPDENRLFQLAQLSNRDKHRILFPAFCFARFWWTEDMNFAIPMNADVGEIASQSLVSGFDSKDHTEICRVKLVKPGPDPKMRMSKGYILEVALSAITFPLNFGHLVEIRTEVASTVDGFAKLAGL